MSESENGKSYRDWMQSVVSDPDLKALDKIHEPYLVEKNRINKQLSLHTRRIIYGYCEFHYSQ